MEFAIIGAAIRLPDVSDIDEFRRALLAGASGFRTVSSPESSGDDPRYVPVASVVESAELFDREFFGMTAGEAGSLDPQHRVLLTLAHEAVQSCALDPQMRRIGVYVSTTLSSWYTEGPQLSRPSCPLTIDYPTMLGNEKDFASARIAHKLGFTGPAVTIQSACSSALVAVHQACAALAFGDADAAVAGGVSVTAAQRRGYFYQEGAVLSPTGQCRPFDRAANGTVKGNGGALVVLRRLDDALDDADPILAVISGSAVNNDGDERMGFTAPSARGQEALINSAVARSGVTAGDVRYVEAHGTGTPLGDPIEFRALARAYGGRAPSALPDCYLGAVKANYGHLDVAAGAVGLVKAMLVVRDGTVFPQVNFTESSELVDLATSRFVIATEPRQFPEHSWAGVSAFGMGGTNAHVVLRAARPGETGPRSPAPAAESAVRVRLSAGSATALTRFRARLSRHLREHLDVRPADVAATLARRPVGDAVCEVRARNAAELAEALESLGTQALGPRDCGAPEPEGFAPAGRRIWLPPTPLDETAVGESADIPTVYATQAAGSARASPPGPAEVRAAFQRYVGEELGSAVTEDADFFAVGGESIALVTIVGKVTTDFGFVADFTRIDGLTTVGALGDELARQAVLVANTAVVNTAAVNDVAPLITFGPPSDVYWHPPAGGANFCYSALSRVCPTVGINAFRMNLRAAADTIEEIAARNIEILGELGLLSNQLVLGGYSFGGNVGLEMAIQLERAGVAPRRLVLFDSIAPEAYQGSDTTGEDFAEAARLMVQNAAHQSAPGDRLAEFTRMIDDHGSASGVLYQDFVRLWQANHRALVAHKPEAVLSCPITIFDSQEPLPSESYGLLGIEALPASAWQRYSAQPLQAIDVPGDHYALFIDPQCLEILGARLPDVVGGTHGR